MEKMREYLPVIWLLVCLLVYPTHSHLCLISPRQRGPMDISQSGSHTCFRHGAECGGVPPEVPANLTLEGGKPIFIKWQQNYNHYSTGYPGYMDIGFAVANDSANKSGTESFDPDPFMILAVVPDKVEFDQDHQRNYTAIVTLPNQNCDHCVIRARYVAHKPGETTFYQCADIRVKMTTQKNVADDTLQLLENSESTTEDDAPPAQILLQRASHVKVSEPTASKISLALRRPHKKSYPLPKLLGLKKTAQSKAPIKHDESKAGEKRIRRALHFINTRSEVRSPSLSLQTNPTANSAQALNQVTQKPPVNTGYHTVNPTPKSSGQSNEVPAPVIYAMSNKADYPNGAVYYSINAETGERKQVGVLDFHIDSPFDPRTMSLRSGNSSIDFVNDGVLTVNPTKMAAVMPLNTHGNMDRVADRIVEMDLGSGKTKAVYSVNGGNGTNLASAFSAVVVEIGDTFATFNIEPSSQAGTYDFVIGRLYSSGKWEELSRTDRSENLYINFMWAEYDIAVKTLYVLLGNENDADGLSARLYKFFVPPGPPNQPMRVTPSYVDLDVSKFTYMSFHINDANTNQLYAISPGLHGAIYPAYHLVMIDVDTGSVTDVMQITPPAGRLLEPRLQIETVVGGRSTREYVFRKRSHFRQMAKLGRCGKQEIEELKEITFTKDGIFERYYGGTIINGVDSLKHVLLHVLRVGDTQADVIVKVNVMTKSVSFSQITNLHHMHNMVYSWNSGVHS